MLTGTKKTRGLGIFGSYAAANDLPNFARFNGYYGENGSAIIYQFDSSGIRYGRKR